MERRLEGYTLDEARQIFQSSIGGVREDEIARQAALHFQLMGDRRGGNAGGVREDEIARQAALHFQLGGAGEDELARQKSLRIQLGKVSEEFWIKVIDHLNQALPYVTNIITGIVGARERMEAMRLQIQSMESANQHELITMEAKNYWLARIAKEQGIQMDPNTYSNAMVFGDALKAMGPNGQAYLNQGYNQAFSMGTNFGAGGEIRDGYMRLTREDWAKVQAGKNLWIWIGLAIGATVFVAGGIVTVVVVTRPV